ncbi:MAG: MAPEG family protein, partial [Sphingomonadaceae bacterium]|nr:MAPEG family protein [Sphingomonadaceae bacterium]
TVVILAIMGGSQMDVLLAWAYVALRIVHSVYQATVNVVAVRFLIFLLATGALLVLAVRALMVTLFANPGVLA